MLVQHILHEGEEGFLAHLDADEVQPVDFQRALVVGEVEVVSRHDRHPDQHVRQLITHGGNELFGVRDPGVEVLVLVVRGQRNAAVVLVRAGVVHHDVH